MEEKDKLLEFNLLQSAFYSCKIEGNSLTWEEFLKEHFKNKHPNKNTHLNKKKRK